MKKEEGLLKKISSTVLDLIYPEEGICFICDEFVDGISNNHICTSCKNRLSFIKERKCSICGKPLDIESISNKCENCKRHPHYFSRAISVLEYKGLVKDAIYRYKYGKKSYMYKAFGPLMVQALKDNNISQKNIDFIVPVPLHRRKLIKRGFNQAELLGKYISDSLNISLSANNLIRTKRTPVLNKLHRLERLVNLQEAFAVSSKEVFKNSRILLVDDIFTTGATANHCSKVLLEAGASNITVICLATGRSS